MTTATDTRFPIGAWVRDPEMQRLTGGLERDAVRGTVRFRTTGGEIVSIGLLGGQPVYRVRFAANEAVVFADGARCYQCAAPDDESHELYCCAGPDGPIRGAGHEPGWASTTEAMRAWEAQR